MAERRELNLPDPEQQERMIREVMDRHEPEHADNVVEFPGVHPESPIKPSISPFDVPTSEKVVKHDFQAPIYETNEQKLKAVNALISSPEEDPFEAMETLASIIDEKKDKAA
jgi:hypothetical protein